MDFMTHYWVPNCMWKQPERDLAKAVEGESIIQVPFWGRASGHSQESSSILWLRLVSPDTKCHPRLSSASVKFFAFVFGIFQRNNSP